MNENRIKASFKSCKDALSKLSQAVDLMEKQKEDKQVNEAYLDAAIKRFEVTFEYTWKLMKIALEYQGKEVFGPRQAIQEAIKFGWIKEPEFWADALDARNGSVHDYFGISKNKYMQLVKCFIKEATKLFEHIEKSLNK